jgi:hypothetical protein
MLKASALYMVIVMALVMAVICSSLIVAAYFYKSQYQRSFRLQQLHNNLASAENILLESKADLSTPAKISLFNQNNDTVILSRKPWGIFEVGVAHTFVQNDTLSSVFTLAQARDSIKLYALYIVDEDRSISVSGKTVIKGTAFLPKAGIKEAYVNSQPYKGDRRLVIGTKKISTRKLPALNDKALQRLKQYFEPADRVDAIGSLPSDSLLRSFMQPTLWADFKHNTYIVNTNLKGNIIIRSDTSITLDGNARLEDVMVFAQSIKVKSGFKGSCQLFATDSVQVEQGCRFNYPSVIGVFNFNEQSHGQRKLSLGNSVNLEGALLMYEKANNDLLPVIDLGKGTTVSGHIYSQGLLNYQDGVVINGSVATTRFLYQTSYTRYENYLINLKIDGSALPGAFLTGELLPAAGSHKKVLQWVK